MGAPTATEKMGWLGLVVSASSGPAKAQVIFEITASFLFALLQAVANSCGAAGYHGGGRHRIAIDI
jgi:hypothetical protein